MCLNGMRETGQFGDNTIVYETVGYEIKVAEPT